MKPRTIAKSIVLVPSVLVLFVLRVLSPLVRVELLVVAFHRYGHLALEPEVLLSRIESEEAKFVPRTRLPKTFRLWSLGPTWAQPNHFLAKKWKEVLLAPPSWCVDSLVHAGERFPWLQLDTPKLSIQIQENSLDDSRPHLSFSTDELSQGRAELTKLGINFERPMVCLIVRDEGYYASRGELEKDESAIFNFDISSFKVAAASLAARGYQVVRMGTGSEKPIGLDVDGVFDYALSPHRSEFLDVFIAAHCQFAVSTQTGPDCVCLAFRRPVCYVDVTRFSQFFFGTKIAYWSPSELRRNGVRMTLKDIVSSEVAWIKNPEQFAEQNIESVRSNPKDIDNLVCGFADLVENNFKWSASEYLMNTHAQKIIESGLGERGLARFGRITAQLNPIFLRQHGDWFLA